MENDKINLLDAKILRMKAEQLLKDKQTKADKLILEIDAKKLVHELQVHQIELEMQNEELLQANIMVEEALKKYTMLYDLAPLGYLTLDSKGTIRELNFTAAEILGDRRFSIENSNINVYIADESKPVFTNFLTLVFNRKAKEACKVTLWNNEKATYTVYMEGIVTDDEQQCLLSVVDISSFIK